MPTPRQLGRRSSVAVLVVLAAAVAMLGLLAHQTSEQGRDVPLMNAVGRQALRSEELVLAALAARTARAEERPEWRERVQRLSAEWRREATSLRAVAQAETALRAGSLEAREYASLAGLETAIARTASHLADATAPPSADDSLVAMQARYGDAMRRIATHMESESAWRVERLVAVEASCVVLLLAALGLGLRLAVQPTQEQLQRTVDALAESESRMRAILGAMDEGMLLVDSGGRMLDWNPAAQRILGLDGTPEQMTHRFVVDRMVNERGEPLPAEELPSRLTIRAGRSLRDVVMGVRHPGGVRWLSTNTHPLLAAPGQPQLVVSIFRDVTRERRAEEERAAQAEALEKQNRALLSQAEALERGQALYRSLVETAGSAIVGLHADGRVFEWNREAEALYGLPRAEAIGKPYTETFVSAKFQEQMRAGIAAVLAGQRLRNIVGPVRSRDGQRHTVLWHIAPLRTGEDGPVHGMIAAGIDITEREASDERFRVLFERSSDAHLLYDEGGIIDCNDATLAMLRAPSRAAVIGRQPTDLSPHRQPDGRLSLVVAAQARELAHQRGYHRFEWTHLRADGSEFPVEVTLTPVRLHGREVILAVWHDIAEQKAVEEALRAAKDAAESANRTKSEFVARMNHELRTPLTAIIGFSRVLLQGREGPLTAGARRYVERVHANGLHLLSLINQVLDVAKVEAGRMELELETVAMDAMIQETLGMLEATAEARGLRLRAELPRSVAPIVTDAGKLRQILINLVGNAIKFTAAGEVVVRVEVDATGRPAALVVRDSGMGIPPDRLEKVFEPFEQGDASTRREFGGTGLGLSIVKTFAELIGARIEVASEVGRGTTFTLRLATAVPSAPSVTRA